MHKSMIRWAAVLPGLLLVLGGGRASALPTPQVSLNTCQTTVKNETTKFIKRKLDALNACLQKIATEKLKNNAATVAAAAGTCVTQFRKIYDTRGMGKSIPEKLTATITKKCAPGQPNVTHTLDDITGLGVGLPEQIESANLNEWCTHFGGDGTVDTVNDWIACLLNAAEASVDAAVVTQYPRALEWLDLVKPAMQALTPPATDPTKIDDAVDGLDAVNASSGDATAADVATGKKGWVDGAEVTGTGIIASGNAVAADVLSGKTFSNTGAAGIAGTMANNGAVSITPGTSAQTIAAGYHNGSGTVAGDADLVASNVVSGVNLFGVTGTALPSQPLKTGQTTCYNAAGTVIACAGTGQDGELQKGVTRSYTDNGDGTITDTKTGLMWEKLSDDGSIHDKDNFYTWTNAFATKVATLNSGSFAGYTDWRLPNINELQTLAKYGTVPPAIDAAFNTSCAASCTVLTCSCTQSSRYWSSSTYQGNPPVAWGVDFIAGNVGDFGKAGNGYVRAVRGGS